MGKYPQNIIRCFQKNYKTMFIGQKLFGSLAKLYFLFLCTLYFLIYTMLIFISCSEEVIINIAYLQLQFLFFDFPLWVNNSRCVEVMISSFRLSIVPQIAITFPGLVKISCSCFWLVQTDSLLTQQYHCFQEWILSFSLQNTYFINQSYIHSHFYCAFI